MPSPRTLPSLWALGASLFGPSTGLDSVHDPLSTLPKIHGWMRQARAMFLCLSVGDGESSSVTCCVEDIKAMMRMAPLR